MDPRREKIVATARSVVGTPWRHQGRDPQRGIDCAGLIIWVGWETGLLPRDFDFQGYRREPDGKSLAQALARHCVQKQWPWWEPGDFVLLREYDVIVWPCHLGILAERPGGGHPNMIHSWAKMTRCVVEVGFDEVWLTRMVGLYRYKELS